MYVWRNIEAGLWNNCCSGKVINITYFGVCARLSYSWCNAHAPYCLRLLWLHHIFRLYLINGLIFGKMLMDIKCVFWFSLQILFGTFSILCTIQRDIGINVKTFSSNVPIVLVGFEWNLKYLDTVSGKKKVVVRYRVRMLVRAPDVLKCL
jgi:hypothetical protein